MVYSQSWKEMKGAQTLGYELAKPCGISHGHQNWYRSVQADLPAVPVSYRALLSPCTESAGVEKNFPRQESSGSRGQRRRNRRIKIVSSPVSTSGQPPCSALGLGFGVSSYLTDTWLQGWWVDSQRTEHTGSFCWFPPGSGRDNLGKFGS